uniref:Desumoylating isopeptidase 1 n=2 Tax=Schistocephalus solidus TaxID=70667 RepID=A0A0X3PIL8_SCHSO
MCLPTPKMCLLTAPKKPKTDVYLFVYDLSHGVSNLLSESLLGKHLEGIWHTAVVVFGSEYFFGVHGVRKCKPGALSIGKPNKRLLIGQTEFTEEEILEFIQKMADGPYREGTYDLFEHNCIYFSEDVIRHLTGKSIPEEILHLPSEILSTPIGQVVKPAVEGILQVMNRESQLVKEIRRVVYGAGSGKRSISAALRRLAYQRPG